MSRRVSKGLAALGATLALLAVGSNAPASAGAPPAGQCQAGAWPAVAQGRSATFHPGAALGIYLWHDPAGWHLRATHPGRQYVLLSGVVRADTAVTDRAVANERNDVISVDPSGESFGFDFHNYGQTDGVDFRTQCATRLFLSFSIDGRPAPTATVRVGRADRHPLTVPFILLRGGTR